jgi:excisionase family DNA binding protein
VPAIAPNTGSPWLTIPEAQAYARRSYSTISDALRSGEMRGSQTKRGGTWLVHTDDLDAWLRGEKADARVPAVSRRTA